MKLTNLTIYLNQSSFDVEKVLKANFRLHKTYIRSNLKFHNNNNEIERSSQRDMTQMHLVQMVISSKQQSR